MMYNWREQFTSSFHSPPRWSMLYYSFHGDSNWNFLQRRWRFRKKKSHRYLTLFRMLVTDWPGKISGIRYKSGSLVTVVSCFNFAEAFYFCVWLAGCQWWSGKVGLHTIQYMGENDRIWIDHLQHTEADVVVEQMGSFICSSQWWCRWNI